MIYRAEEFTAIMLEIRPIWGMNSYTESFNKKEISGAKVSSHCRGIKVGRFCGIKML